jgi:hypothetical protein
MAKKKRYKKVFKGKRYINTALKKYFTKRYPNALDRQKRAQQIYNQITKDKNKVILKSIFALERKPQKKRLSDKPTPPSVETIPGLLPGNLSEPKYYFQLEDLSNEIINIKRSDLGKRKIFFKSSLSDPQLPMVEAGGNMSYYEYFQNFTKYCNLENSQSEKQTGTPVSSSSEEMQFVTCTEPIELKKGSNEFISTIISCDNEGNPVDFGFDPNTMYGDAPITPRQPRTTQLPKERDTISKRKDITAAELSMQEKLNRAKELELRDKELSGLTPQQKFDLLKMEKEQKFQLEKTRQDQIGVFLKMFAEGKITKAEYKEFTKNL